MDESLNDIKTITRAIEAILFAAGHPITYTNLARVLNLTPGKVKDIVVEYARQYNTTDMPRGVILLAYEDSCQLCTKQYYLHEIREALGIRRGGNLSASSMEVLAVVAYNQPVTRTYIDTVRGVDSSYAVNSLLDKELIEACGRLDAPGRPMLYATTEKFLRVFGLNTLNDLPQTELPKAPVPEEKTAETVADEINETAEQTAANSESKE